MTTTETTTATPRFRYIGITDDVTDCAACGKVELKSTVVIMPLDEDGNDEGEVTYYGSVCAARALGIPGGGAAVRGAATRAMVETMIAAEEALRWLERNNLTRDGKPNALAEKLGLADQLMASVSTDPLYTHHVSAVRDADALGVDDPKAWLKRGGWL